MCIIIIAHNNAGTLRKALDLLVNSELANKIIILVDNNSVDDFRLIIRKFMAKGLFLSRNTGFAAGVNIGFKACISAESYFVLSNPDAIATRDWLRKLVEFMYENSDTGMAQGLLLSLMVSMIQLVASLIGLVTRLSSSLRLITNC